MQVTPDIIVKSEPIDDILLDPIKTEVLTTTSDEFIPYAAIKQEPDETPNGFVIGFHHLPNPIKLEMPARSTTKLAYTTKKTGRGKIECKICLRNFKEMRCFIMHIRVHNGEKPFVCALCPKTFAYTKNLTAHQRLVHNFFQPRSFKNSSYFDCDICGECVMGRKNLEAHRAIHTGPNVYECPMCPLKFTNRTTFMAHKKDTHKPGVKLFQCDICKKYLKSRKNLEVHTRIHEMRKAKCEVCQEIFLTRKFLIRHMKVHDADNALVQDVKPKFECRICGKICKQKAGLVQHGRVHMVDKLLRCNICQRMFTNISRLTTHRRNNHMAKKVDDKKVL